MRFAWQADEFCMTIKCNQYSSNADEIITIQTSPYDETGKLSELSNRVSYTVIKFRMQSAWSPRFRLPLSHAASIHFKINNTLTVDPPALIHWATFDPSFSINSGNTDVRNTKFNGHKNEVWEEILAKTQIMPCDSKRYFQQRSAFLSKHLFVWRFSGDYLYMLHT